MNIRRYFEIVKLFCLFNHLPGEKDRENEPGKQNFSSEENQTQGAILKATSNLKNANHKSSSKLVTLKCILSGPTEKAQK